MKRLEALSYKTTFLISLILIALGITASTAMKENSGSLGTVIIAVGGLFLIISMAKKRKEDEDKKK